MEVEESVRYTTELREDGMITVSKWTKLLKDGVQIGAENYHSSVLNPASKDYDDKFDELIVKLHSQTAIDQQVVIIAKNKEASDLKTEKEDLVLERDNLKSELDSLKADNLKLTGDKK